MSESERVATNQAEEPSAPDDVRASSSVPDPEPSDPDAALKDAIKAALDAGLFDRARALLEVLTKTPRAAEVVDLRERRRGE